MKTRNPLPMIIDAYTHCGVTKFLPVEEVLGVMEEAGVERAVLCQHLGEYDNSYLAEVVARYPGRFAAVCLVDPDNADAVNQLRRWHGTGRFRGLRVVAEWLPRNLPLWLEAADLGMNLVVYAPDGLAKATPHILELVRQRPDASIVISHLGNPQVCDGRFTAGAELLSLATKPNVYVLLSGLSMFCEYPYTAMSDLLCEVIRQFGLHRTMWGSNFPVCGDRQAYRRDLALAQSGAWGFDPKVTEWIIGRTAKQVWFD
jgi:L-fuconolactonase